MRKILLVLLTSIFVLPPGAFAQTPADGRGGAGTMREAVNREAVRLAALPPAVRQQPPRERSWPGRHPVLFGALVGLGAGFAIEAAVIPGKSGGEPHSAYLPMFGSIGAGIGSLVGMIVAR
jgi:hypothetical protein